MNLLNKSTINSFSDFIPKKKMKLHLNQHQTHEETKEIVKRLQTQSFRRPTSLIINMIQPLLWLLMFGALFQNAPIYLFEHYTIQYREFLNPGIIVFTGFNSAINAGLPLIFDREFGFLNRILISPISNKNSLIYSCIIHSWLIATTQIIIIILVTISHNNNTIHFNINQLLMNIIISTIIISNIAAISIWNALILPGHIEFIALTTLLINLPTLFASTALAPLSFMPTWLQMICCINPLTYAIEIIRNQSLNKSISISTEIINTTWLTVNIYQGVLILIFINIISIVLVKKIIRYKYD
uniref:ABC transmembrane type-2 domain-containing protein n=1 Tax=Symphyocladiella dendroidea TaxID=2506487 RepID=A0A1Z1M7I2_9FLOR|nr:hypothetical protein [Symphyocladiella dendroidea]ARW61939.1 hypothetical protein [Symphyocladiella dendroidea]